METIVSKQGTITFEERRSGNLCIVQNPTSEDRECIYVSPSEALKLAHTIIENCGEWLPIDDMPLQDVLCKLKGADYAYGIYVHKDRCFWHPVYTKQLKPTHYQIIQP